MRRIKNLKTGVTWDIEDEKLLMRLLSKPGEYKEEKPEELKGSPAEAPKDTAKKPKE